MSGLMHPSTLTQGLISGLGPITLAAIAFVLRRADDRVSWRWLLYFALGQGLREWLGALPDPWATAGAVTLIRSGISIASFIALMEFARLGFESFLRRGLPRWILVAIAVPLAAGTHQGFFIGSLEWTLLLSVIAGGGAALVLWRAGAEESPSVRRWLRLGGLAIGAYAILAGLGADLWRVPAAVGTGLAPVRAAWSFTGPILREIFGLAAAALLLVFSLWRDSIGEHGVSRWRATIAVSGATGLLLVLIVGALLRGPFEARLARHGIPAIALLALGVSGASFGLWVVLLASWRAAAQWASWTRRQSRNLLTSITESMDGGLLAVDAGGRILYQNAAFSELWEIPAGFMQEGEARILFGFLRDRLDEPEAFAAMIERALQVPERVDENLRLKDGRVFRCRTNPLPGEPAVPGRVFSFFEITEHTRIEAERQVRESRRERQNEALTTLAQRLAQSAPGGRALALREICEVTAAALEVGRVSLWTCEGEDEAPHCAEFSDRLPESDPATTAQRVAAYADLYRCLPPERPVVIDDAREDARVREACERQPLLRDITSLVQLPVETDGRIAGVVSLVHVGVPRRWTGDEQRFASAVASLCAAALEQFRRQQAQQELGHALEFQRQMAETACSAIYQLDAEGRIVAVNSALCRLTGHLPEDLIGQPVSILGAGACGAECQMLGDGLHEPLLRHPCWMSDRNGRRLDIVRNASSIVDSEGRHAGTIVSFVDVSEVADARRQAEEALRMSQRAQAKLRTADERVEALEAEMIQLRGGLEGREREQREDRERIQALEKELTQGREEREAAQWSGTTARRDAEEMRAERDGALAASAAARRELEAAHGETESARRETEVARGEQAQARAEVEAVRRDLDESREDASRVRAQVQEAQEDRRMPERELLRAKTELAQVRAELGATREAVESARCQAESAYQELRASRQEGEASRAEAVAFARQVTGLQEQVDRLKTDLEASRASTGAAEAARAAAEQRAAAEKRAAMERRVATPTAAGGKAATLPRSLPTPARAAPVARPAAPSAIDFAALLAAVGGDHDLATRRLHAFQKGAPWMLSRLRQAFVKKNALALVSAAESIRQATADLSAREAVRRAEQLEELARSGDLAKLETALNELEAEVERVRAALSSLPRAA